MRTLVIGSILALLAGGTCFGAEDTPVAGEKPAAAKSPQWSMRATIIEACSCPMFCQCYFVGKPAGHGGHDGHEMEHFCKFNNAYKVDRGRYGKTNLAGAKFWLTGDLGGEFGMGRTEWAILTFDPAVTAEQREGIKTILGHVYPFNWENFTVAEDATVEWAATKDRAEAKLDGGKRAEVVLNRFQGMTDEPIVMKNLKYFGAPRNSGFLMMPNEIETYRTGEKAFEFKGTNGFMVTFDISSKDVEKK